MLAALKGSQVLIFIYGLESRLGVLEWSWAAVLEWILEVEPWRESCEWNRKYFFFNTKKLSDMRVNFHVLTDYLR